MGAILEWQLIHRADQAEAILDPIRQKILQILCEPGSASSLGKSLDLPRQKVNYHLKKLESVGLVLHTGQERKRNCVEQFFQSSARSYAIADSVLDTLSFSKSGAKSNPLDKVAGIGERLVQEAFQIQSQVQSGKPPAVLSLDTVVTFASDEARNSFGRDFRAAVQDLLARYGTDEDPSLETFRVVLAIHPKL